MGFYLLGVSAQVNIMYVDALPATQHKKKWGSAGENVQVNPAYKVWYSVGPKILKIVESYFRQYQSMGNRELFPYKVLTLFDEAQKQIKGKH